MRQAQAGLRASVKNRCTDCPSMQSPTLPCLWGNVVWAEVPWLLGHLLNSALPGLAWPEDEGAVARQVVSLLVGEIVLCIKEVNKRTRIAAYELLVGLAKVMHEEHPPQACFEQDAAMGWLRPPSRTLCSPHFMPWQACGPFVISASISSKSLSLLRSIQQGLSL